jgi:hypothetical protein
MASSVNESLLGIGAIAMPLAFEPDPDCVLNHSELEFHSGTDWNPAHGGTPVPTGSSRYRWDLSSCKDCGATNTLSIQKMTLEVEKGKPKTNSVEVIGKLLLAPDEVAPLIHLGRRLGKREPEVASQAAA